MQDIVFLFGTRNGELRTWKSLRHIAGMTYLAISQDALHVTTLPQLKIEAMTDDRVKQEIATTRVDGVLALFYEHINENWHGNLVDKGPKKPKISDTGCVEQPGDELSLLSEEIILLVFDKRYEEAKSLLGTVRKRSPKGQACRLEALFEILREKLAKVENSDASVRQALACLCMLSDMLMDAEYWGDAEIVLSELIGLSLAANEAFFLDDSRFRRADA